MIDVLWQGLIISVLGMGLTFLALGLLILVMVLLERFTRSSVVSAEQASEEELSAGVLTRPEDEEIAAAITVALTQLRALDIGPENLGARLEAGHGAWWTRGAWLTTGQSAHISKTRRWRN